MTGRLCLLAALIILNAVLSYAETAFEAVNPAKICRLADEGEKRAVRLRKIMDEPDGVFSALSTAASLAALLGAAFAAVSFSGILADYIMKFGFEEYSAVLKPVSAVAVTIVFLYLTIVFGQLVPEHAALKNAEKSVLRVSGLIRFVSVIFAPFVIIQDFSANIFLRLIGINPDDADDAVTEEEILMMSDAGAEKGTIDEDENRIIKNVFEFDDLTAEQVCTHRTDVVTLWSDDSVETWEETIHRTRHSLFPVCGESVDNIIGILDAKDYFRLEHKSRDNIMRNAVREPYFVHENMKADVLFAQMKKRGGHHFAVVVDEYGGMTGIITVTDLVEELVGDFDDDELSRSEPQFKQIGENKWIIPGITALDKVCEELETELPSEKYDTFGGYVIAGLGEIPKDGLTAELESDGLRIEILKIYHHRAEVCRVTKI